MNDSGSIEETIFIGARDLLSPQERAVYLDNACGNDPALRERVERMLNAEQKADQFLANNPLEVDKSPLSPTDVSENVGSMIGRYKLLQKIGEGGCGIVYMAEQEEPIRRRVALKVIKLGMDTKQVIARFEAERQALAMMDHPNIARVFDAGTTESSVAHSEGRARHSVRARRESSEGGAQGTDAPYLSAGRPYFVMELVRGIRITEYCDQNNLSTRERLDLFVKVAQAIQHAHQKGIIHRDIKPSNVLVTLHDGVPVPKVIDFGIAKATEQKLTDKTMFTQFAQFLGTPAYTSPEQAEMSGLDIDTRSDIYSLGVLLYELLVSKTPFEAKELLRSGLDEMRRIIREKEPNRPSTRLSTMQAEERTATAQHRAASSPELIHLLKGDLDWIVMKCLEKDRTRRYETANGLATDIINYLSDEPVLARPPSATYRLGKLFRRNKLAFAASTAVALALVIGMVVSAWQAARARRAEQAAQTEKDSAEAVLNFFQGKLLAAGRPEGQDGGLGKDVTLREAIDAAESQIAKAFQDRPLVEASIRHTIGESYMFLSQPTQSIQQLERALALCRQALGLEHPRTLSTMDSLSGAYSVAGKHNQALPLAEKTLKLRKAKLGPEHHQTLSSMNELGLVYLDVGKVDQALPLFAEALKLERVKKGPEHRDTLATMNNLALAYQSAGKLDQALPLFAEAFKLKRARYPEHPDTLITMKNLAWAYSKTGKFDQALPLFEEALKLLKAKLGLKHHTTRRAMLHFAEAYADAGKLDQAEELFDEMLKRLSELREDQPAIAAVLQLRGQFHVRRGQWNEGTADFTEALQREPTDHELYHFLTACLVKSGDLEAYRRHCQQIMARFAGATNAIVAHRAAKDCSILPASGVDLATLDKLTDRAIAVGEADRAFVWVLCGKGLVEYRQSRYAGAAETMQKVLDKNGSNAERGVQAWMVLAMARHQLQEHDQARSALAEGLQFAETLPKPESGDLGGGWVDCIFAHALIREARMLIERNAP